MTKTIPAFEAHPIVIVVSEQWLKDMIKVVKLAIVSDPSPALDKRLRFYLSRLKLTLKDKQ